jgi:hypothetical protein
MKVSDDPEPEHREMNVDEKHAAAKARDCISYSVLRRRSAFLPQSPLA